MPGIGGTATAVTSVWWCIDRDNAAGRWCGSLLLLITAMTGDAHFLCARIECCIDMHNHY